MQVASITSNPQPLPGQSARSSGNELFLGNTGRIRVEFETDGEDPENITCDLVEDVTAGSDRLITSLSHKSRFEGTKVNVSLTNGDRYYISNVQGAQRAFTAIFKDER